MRDLSLHIMDIIQNSVAAKASRICLGIAASKNADILEISISDNGVGMDREFANMISDPFVTTRKTRRVGLGIPLLKASAQMSSGDLFIESEKGKGTTLKASFKISHIDRPPLGDVAETITSVIVANPDIDLEIVLRSDEKHFNLHTGEIKQRLGEVPIAHYEVLSWIKEYINEGIKTTFGGVLDEIDS